MWALSPPPAAQALATGPGERVLHADGVLHACRACRSLFGPDYAPFCMSYQYVRNNSPLGHEWCNGRVQ